jgi:hypothetical protein
MTGVTFARIDKPALEQCHRLVYRCPPDFRDGNEITFRSTTDEIEDALPPHATYDLIFVDGWHTYQCSLRDIKLAFERLSPGGAVVLHDCLPLTKAMSGPRPPASWESWSGLTYCAYIDFVWSQPEISYYTVDTDSGCGIIRKQTGQSPAPQFSAAVYAGWRERRAARDFDVFDFFDQHRVELTNQVSVDEFLVRESLAREDLVPSPRYLMHCAAAEARNFIATRPRRRLQRQLQAGGWLS